MFKDMLGNSSDNGQDIGILIRFDPVANKIISSSTNDRFKYVVLRQIDG